MFLRSESVKAIDIHVGTDQSAKQLSGISPSHVVGDSNCVFASDLLCIVCHAQPLHLHVSALERQRQDAPRFHFLQARVDFLQIRDSDIFELLFRTYSQVQGQRMVPFLKRTMCNFSCNKRDKPHPLKHGYPSTRCFWKNRNHDSSN